MSNTWQFASRFRRHIFGWRSDAPIQRIKEALVEIKQVAREEPILAAEGAIRFLEKLSPALVQVDSSSGALGSAVNKAIHTLVPIIAKAEVDARIRQKWLERLWQALLNDEIPYIESLGDYWGELCVTPEHALHWVEVFVPLVEDMWSQHASKRHYFKGTSACFSSLYAAGRHSDLLRLLETAPYTSWYYRLWGVKALVALGKKEEAILYAEASRGRSDPDWPIAEACEAILLSLGMADEAYRRYAIEANQTTTGLATFRAIVKKYPNIERQHILSDLIASTPGSEGRWFATAKDAGLFDVAIELACASPTDPRTLIRAARDYAGKQPPFAVLAALAALRWIARGHGYEITSEDILDARSALLDAAAQAKMGDNTLRLQIDQVLAEAPPKHLIHRLMG